MTPDDQDWDHDPIIAEYIGAFSARQDLYVMNNSGLIWEELSPEVVRQAVLHNHPVSGYLGHTDGRTHVGAIDFDRTDGVVRAKEVQDYLDDCDIPSLLAESRDGRAHLRITSWDWVKAAEMRRMIRHAVRLVLGDEAAADPAVEVFPKRGSDLATGALRLPGLAHPKTGEVYPIRTLHREVAPTFRDILEQHTLTTPLAIKRQAMLAQPSGEWPKSDDIGTYYGFREKRDFGPEPSASDVLSGWGVQIRPGGTGRCPKHDDKHGSLTVFRDDKRVYCGAPHCPLNNGGHGVGSVMLSRMPAPG